MVRADEGPRRALLQGGVGSQAGGAPSGRSRASLRPSKGMGPPLRGVVTSYISLGSVVIHKICMILFLLY